jgi:hypothetical protein
MLDGFEDSLGKESTKGLLLLLLAAAALNRGGCKGQSAPLRKRCTLAWSASRFAAWVQKTSFSGNCKQMCNVLLNHVWS